ncbi:MAG: tyrosine-protein phosphatase [Pseudonocardiaceae bacterium]
MSRTRQGRLTGSGMVNFRDLGGLPAGAGARTGHGVLYRGDAPHHEDTPPPGLAAWPPVLVLDLREPDEPMVGGHPLAGPDTDVVQVPLLAGPHVGDWRVLSSLEELYLGSLSRASERIGEVLDLLTGVTGPTLVHCAAGKDRTGVLVAVLLRAAGVSRDAVLEDYLRTEPNVPALLEQLAWDLSLLDEEERLRAQHIAGTSASALRAVLDELDAAPGGVLGWLRAHGVPAATIHVWTQRLTGG